MMSDHMIYAARMDGWPGYVAVCVDDPACKKDTAREIASWVKKGWTVERVTREQSVAGLREYVAEQERRKKRAAGTESGRPADRTVRMRGGLNARIIIIDWADIPRAVVTGQRYLDETPCEHARLSRLTSGKWYVFICAECFEVRDP